VGAEAEEAGSSAGVLLLVQPAKARTARVLRLVTVVA
jgi:hypothetical protein